MEGAPFATSVVQVTNIAPQATKDQMNTLFSFVGRVDDVRLYPSVRDASISIPSRCCFVKFADPSSVTITLHLNNTVFIDRAIIITPVLSDMLPEENEGLVMAMQVQQQQQQGGVSISGNGVGPGSVKSNDSRILSANPGLVSLTPGGRISTPDSALEDSGLPSYPLLSADIPVVRVGEIRRTVTVAGLDSTISAQQCMEFFADHAGEVKYFRYCTRENDSVKFALVEFTERTSVPAALKLNGSTLGTTAINIVHATEAINKPQNKSNEAVQKEIEEAMSKVKEANCLVSAAVDPIMGMIGSTATGSALGGLGMSLGRSTRSRSRGMSSRRSRTPHGRRRRSRSRSRRRSRSRDRRRYRSRSRSRDRRRHKRSMSRSRDRHRKSRSRDRKRDGKKERENGEKENGENPLAESGSVSSLNEKRRSRTKSPSRKRSRSRDRRRRSRSRSKDRRRRRSRSRSRDRRRRSRSKDRRRGSSRDRHRSKDRKRSRSRDRKESPKKLAGNKITRDYDQEEVGFENDSSKKLAPIVEMDEGKNHGGEAPMEISDSP